MLLNDSSQTALQLGMLFYFFFTTALLLGMLFIVFFVEFPAVGYAPLFLFTTALQLGMLLISSCRNSLQLGMLFYFFFVHQTKARNKATNGARGQIQQELLQYAPPLGQLLRLLREQVRQQEYKRTHGPHGANEATHGDGDTCSGHNTEHH